MAFGVRSIFDRIREEEEERQRTWAIGAQSSTFKKWMTLGQPAPGMARAMNPIGAEYLADKQKDSSLRPSTFFDSILTSLTEGVASAQQGVAQVQQQEQDQFLVQQQVDDFNAQQQALEGGILGPSQPFMPQLPEPIQRPSPEEQIAQLTAEAGGPLPDFLTQEVLSGGNIAPTQGPLGVQPAPGNPILNELLAGFATFTPEVVQERLGEVPVIGPGLEEFSKALSPLGIAAGVGGLRGPFKLAELAAEASFIPFRSATDPIDNPLLREGLPILGAIGTGALAPALGRAAGDLGTAVSRAPRPDFASEFGGGVPPFRRVPRPGEEALPPLRPDEPPARAGGELFHETSPDNALVMFQEGTVPSRGPAGRSGLFVSDSADLALGQGESKGATVVFRSDRLSTRQVTPPGQSPELAELGTNFRVEDAAPDAIIEVRFRNDALKPRLSQHLDELSRSQTQFGLDIERTAGETIIRPRQPTTPLREGVPADVAARAPDEAVAPSSKAVVTEVSPNEARVSLGDEETIFRGPDAKRRADELAGEPPVGEPPKTGLPPRGIPSAQAALDLKEETLLRPGKLTQVPGFKQFVNVVNPSVGMERQITVAYTARQATRASLETEFGALRNRVIKNLEEAWGDERLAYIGPANNKSQNTIKDFLDHPSFYDPPSPALAAAALEFDAVSDQILDRVRSGFNVNISRFQPTESGSIYTPTSAARESIEDTVDAITLRYGQSLTARQSPAKARIFDSAYDRQLAQPGFVPETDLKTLMAQHDRALASMAGNETFALGIRDLPAESAAAADEILQTKFNVSIAEGTADIIDEIRLMAFGGDVSPLSIQFLMGILSNPIVAARSLPGAARSLINPEELVKIAQREPGLVRRFTQATGRPFGEVGPEFVRRAKGIERIPGGRGLNDRLMSAVELLRYNQWKTDTFLVEKLGGATRNVADAEAANAGSKIIPALNAGERGVGVVRARLERLPVISTSFIGGPATLIKDTASGIAKLAGNRALSPAARWRGLAGREQLAIVHMVSMASTAVSAGIVSHMIFGRSPEEAARLVLDPDSPRFISIAVSKDRFIPIGGPLRSAIKAFIPRKVSEIDGVPVYVPFTGVPRWMRGKITPGLNIARGAVTNKDYFGNPIAKGEFPENVLRSVWFGVNQILPLAASDPSEAIRTGRTEPTEFGELAERGVAQLGGIDLRETSDFGKRLREEGEAIARHRDAGALTGSYDDEPTRITDLTGPDKKTFERLEPEIFQESERSLQEFGEGVLAGLSDRQRNFFRGDLVNKAKVKRDDELGDVKKQAIRGDPSDFPFRGTLEDLIRESLKTYGDVVAAGFDQFEVEAKEANSDEQRLLNRYREFEEQHQRRFRIADKEQRDAAWTSRDAAYARKFTTAEQASLVELRQVGDHELEIARGELSSSLSAYYDVDENRRESFRRKNPEIDGALWALGRTSCLTKGRNRPQAVAAWRQLYGTTPVRKDMKVCQ